MSSEYNRAVQSCLGMMPDGLDLWIRSKSLEDVFGPNLYTTVVWIKNCLYPSASQDVQLITCMDLGMWFYYLDDYSGDDDLDLFEACVTLIDGEPIEHAAMPMRLSDAYQDVMARVSALPGYSDVYLSTRRELVSWYKWRNPVNRSSASVSSREYLECRQSTIYIRQWMALMCCFRDCHPRGVLAPLALDMVDVMIEWHILINEIASVDKDRTRGETNLIILRASEANISLEDAVAASLRSLNDVTREYKLKFQRLSTSGNEPWLRDFLEIVDASIVGALSTYHENVKRYQASFGVLTLPPRIW